MRQKPNKSGNFRRAAATRPASPSTRLSRAAGAAPPKGLGSVGVHLAPAKRKKYALDPAVDWLRSLPDDRLGALLRHAIGARTVAHRLGSFFRASL